MRHVNGLPQFQQGSPVISPAAVEAARYSNKFLLNGAGNLPDPATAGGANMVVFLQCLRATGPVTIADADGIPICVVQDFELHGGAEIPIEGGIQVTGPVQMLTGFYVALNPTPDP